MHRDTLPLDGPARVTLHRDGPVVEVRLARADKINALDPAMFDAVAAAIEQLATSDARVVIVSGEGRGFCAGLDMASMASGGLDRLLAPRGDGASLAQQVAWGWRTLPMPVIAAVHGVAIGGGFQIILGADIRIAAPGTRMAIREVHWGLVPDMAGFALWPTLARDDVLRELTYTGREFLAEEALALGLVTRIADDPLASALALAHEIAARSPDAVQGAKRLFNRAHADAPGMLRAERDEQARVLARPNQAEAVRANLEKRTPRFVD